MTRISDRAGTDYLNNSLNRIKSKILDLQLKGGSLKNINKPSDNPLGNIKVIKAASRIANNAQYMKNISKAILRLNSTEDALVQLTEGFIRAKEIAISQSSDVYNAQNREMAAEEIKELRNRTLALANKRIGNRYIFGGFSSHKPPFSKHGEYLGDDHYITIEVAKDYFIPTNLPGNEVFFTSGVSSQQLPDLKRTLASQTPFENYFAHPNIINLLDILAISLENNAPEEIRSLLERFDESISRLIMMRTKIGSLSKSLTQIKSTNELDQLNDTRHKSEILDADVAKVFSDISRNNDILKSVYHTSKMSLNQNLLDWLR
jgi:flagellar hook-associated protein 3 FlgL